MKKTFIIGGNTGTAKDIANVIDFLTSDKSSYITGITIPVGGGLRLLSQAGIFKN